METMDDVSASSICIAALCIALFCVMDDMFALLCILESTGVDEGAYNSCFYYLIRRVHFRPLTSPEIV